MRRFAVIWSSLVFGAIALGACASTPQDAKSGTSTGPDAELVYRVKTVTADVLERSGDRLTVRIAAQGVTRTGGWKQPVLVPVETAHDSQKAFQFVATPPQGMAAAALTPIRASRQIEVPNAPDVEIAVRTETNHRTISIPDTFAR